MPKQSEHTIIPRAIFASAGEWKDDNDPTAPALPAYALQIIDPPDTYTIVLTPEQKDELVKGLTSGIEIAKVLPPQAT